MRKTACVTLFHKCLCQLAKFMELPTAQGSELPAFSVGRGEENLQGSELGDVSCIPWAVQSWSPDTELVGRAK